MKDRSFRAFVDRFEGDKAVLLLGENEEQSAILPRSFLPDEADESAVLTITIHYEQEHSNSARLQVEELIRKLSCDEARGEDME